MKRLLISFGVLIIAIFGAYQLGAEAKSLEVQATSSSQTIPRNGVRIPLLLINLRTQDEAVTLNGLTLSRSGLSSSDDIGRVWLQKDYTRLSRARQFTNDDQLTLEFTKPYTLPANTTDRIYVLANLEFEGGGRTLRLNLESIDSDAEIMAPTLRTTTQPKQPTRTPGVFTTTKSQYDRSEYRIKCKNSRCSLVKR